MKAAPARLVQLLVRGMDTERTMVKEPVFELHGNNGHAWKPYEDGTATGFLDGTLVVDRAYGKLNSLRARIEQLPTSGVTDEQR